VPASTFQLEANVASAAIITEVELKEELRASDTLPPDRLKALLDRATAVVESLLERGPLIQPTTDRIEWHAPTERQSFLYTVERPIISITSIVESGVNIDVAKFYVDYPGGKITKTPAAGVGAGALAPFFVDFPEDYYLRYSAQMPPFAVGPHTTCITYRAGYADVTSVDLSLKMLALKAAVTLYRTAERKLQGVSSQSVAMGATTRFTEEMFNSQDLALARTFTRRSYTAEA